MNELEEWETIYKEIVCNRITCFHFSHSLRFLFVLAALAEEIVLCDDARNQERRYIVPTHEILKYFRPFKF